MVIQRKVISFWSENASSQFPEKSAHFIGEQRRLFQRREMSTLGHNGPAANVGEHARRRGARRLENLTWELCIADRYRDGIAGRQNRGAVKGGIIRPE